MFNYDSSTKEISSVEFVTSIVGITVIIKFNESKAGFHKNVKASFVPSKKVLNIA